jgi:predicted nucleic acid-binding protein
MSVVVSDTSPIRALDHLKLTSLFSRLYGEVLIPPGVAEELCDPASSLPPLEWANIPGLRLRAPSDIGRVSQLLDELDRGESEAIVLAIEVHAAALLVDERQARGIAVSLGLKPVGTLAMLIRAKEQGFVSAVTPLMEQLRTGIGFHISPALHAEIRHLAKEED